MDYSFNGNTHGDLIVNMDSSSYNFGYNSLLTIPSFIWLACWQQRRGNLFRDTGYPEDEKEQLSEESQDTLNEVIAFSRTLPLEIRDFNIKSQIQNFSSFTSGTHSIRYCACLQSDGGILYSSQARGASEQTPLFTLDNDDYFSFTHDYVSFVQKSENFGKYRWEVPGVVSRLGKISFYVK